ncbi:type II secretion system GspH family protein [Patescibacteria group bacterium]|nr:type II secretion system GspH family protein [Patescibacteria group bacterium]
MKKLFRNAGFTMIELLIVISILGILAVAVLSAINPIEQINRGRDTGSRSDAEQLLSAIDRYNAFQGYFPWQTGASDTTHLAYTWTSWDLASSVADTNTTPCPVSEKLSTATTGTCVGSGELKITFFTRIFDTGYNHLFIYNKGGQGDSTYICFAPKSNAFVTEAANRVLAGLPTDYPSTAVQAVANTTDCGASGNCVCLP